MKSSLLLLGLCLNCVALDAARLRCELEPGHFIWGTCFAVSEDMLLTACHTLTNANSVLVETEHGWEEASIEDADLKNDIALLKRKRHGLRPLVLADHKVTLIASNLGQRVEQLAGSVQRLIVEVRCAGGCSGAPVVVDGKVVGMAVACVGLPDKDGYHEFCSCVPARDLLKFWEKHR